MIRHTIYLYLLSPLHTGGASQEGNLLGIARESHTELPYIPSSTIRGRLRAETDEDGGLRKQLWGNTLEDVQGIERDSKTSSSTEVTQATLAKNLTQGDLWVGDASILWIPVPSLSHGVVWVSCPLLLRRWAGLQGLDHSIPEANSTNLAVDKPIYLKDAIFQPNQLTPWNQWQDFIPHSSASETIQKVLVLADQHCATLVQMSLWRQVKIRLDSHKQVVDGAFRYEEAIPPDTLMYFPWGLTMQAARNENSTSQDDFQQIMSTQEILQIGGQESLGRGFVQQWLGSSQTIQQEATV